MKNNLYAYKQSPAEMFLYTGLKYGSAKQVKVTKLSTKPKGDRNVPALANWQNSHIFISGGSDLLGDGDLLKTVDIYSIRSNSWSSAPLMKTKR